MAGRGAGGGGEDVLAYVRMTDFTGGEISPLLEGRVDLAKYFSSCRQMANFLPLVQGGATRRAGTALVAVLAQTQAPGLPPGFVTWNPADMSTGGTLDTDKLVFNSATLPAAVRALYPQTKGKFCWEGIGGMFPSNGSFAGIVDSTVAIDTLAADAGIAGTILISTFIFDSGEFFIDGTHDPNGAPNLGDGTNYAFALDLDADKIWYRWTNGNQGSVVNPNIGWCSFIAWAGNGDPTAGTSGIDITPMVPGGRPVFPAVTFYVTGVDATTVQGVTGSSANQYSEVEVLDAGNGNSALRMIKRANYEGPAPAGYAPNDDPWDPSMIAGPASVIFSNGNYDVQVDGTSIGGTPLSVPGKIGSQVNPYVDGQTYINLDGVSANIAFAGGSNITNLQNGLTIGHRYGIAVNPGLKKWWLRDIGANPSIGRGGIDIQAWHAAHPSVAPCAVIATNGNGTIDTGWKPAFQGAVPAGFTPGWAYPGGTFPGSAPAITDLPGVRLVPFVATEDDAYVVILQAGTAQFATNDGMVVSGGAPYVLGTSYPASSLPALQWSQLNDVMWLVDGTLPANFLQFTGPTDWAIDEAAFKPQGPYLDLNPTIDGAVVTTLTSSAATGSATLTASGVLGINGNQGFLATDVGRSLRMLLPDPLADDYDPTSANGTLAWGGFEIGTVVNSGTVTGTAFLRPSWPTFLTSSQWQLEAFSATTGYPAAVAFWGGRVWYGGTPTQPNTLFGSYTGNFIDFQGSRRDGTVTEADAVDFTLTDPQADGIRWIHGAGSAQMAQLGLGTRASEHILMSGSYGQALSADSVQGYRESNYGTRAQTPPIGIGKSLIFPRLYGKKLNDWSYAWQAAGYLSTDLLKLAEHLAEPGGVHRMAWQQEPAWTLWCVTGDGRLLALTYLKEENVAAWSQHTLGGTWYGGPPQVLDIACIPNVTIGQDEVWLLVARTAAGGETLTLETLQPPFRSTRTGALGLDDAWFVDGGIRSSLVYGNAVLQVAGLADARPLDTMQRPFGPPLWGAVGSSCVCSISTAIFTNAAGAGPGTAAGKPGGAAAPVLAPSLPALGAIIRANGGKCAVTGFTDAQHVTAIVIQSFTSLAPVAPGGWSCTPRFTSFSGLDLWDGQTVSVFGDGSDLGDQVVMNGTIVLAQPGASYVVAGLPYRSDLETVKLETEIGPAQTALGKVKRINRLYARLYESIGGWQGPDAATLDALPPSEMGAMLTSPLPLFTGDVRVTFPGGAGKAGTVHLLQDRPIPFTCLALVAAMEPTT